MGLVLYTSVNPGIGGHPLFLRPVRRWKGRTPLEIGSAQAYSTPLNPVKAHEAHLLIRGEVLPPAEPGFCGEFYINVK